MTSDRTLVLDIMPALRDACPPEFVPVTHRALRLSGVDRPGPDVAVVAGDHATLPAIRAEHVLLAVDVLPRNWRFHEMYARMQRYATAGIEHYWLVDPHFDTGTVLTQYRRGPDGRYEPVQDADGIFTTDVPYPVTIDLPKLTERRKAMLERARPDS